MSTNDQAVKPQTKSWPQLSFREKFWTVLAALDDSTDHRLERRLQLLEQSMQTMQSMKAHLPEREA